MSGYLAKRGVDDKCRSFGLESSFDSVVEITQHSFVLGDDSSDDSGIVSRLDNTFDSSEKTIVHGFSDTANAKCDATSIFLRRKVDDAEINRRENSDDEILPPIENLHACSDTESLPQIERLTLENDCESLDNTAESNLAKEFQTIAGVVTSVVTSLGLLIVKPPPLSTFLLDIGSPLFICEDGEPLSINDVAFGNIIDVFGPANEPYYCVKPFDPEFHAIDEGSRLIYFNNHPRTTFIRLLKDPNNRYTVTYSSTYSSQHSEEQLVADGSWNDTYDRLFYIENRRSRRRATFGSRRRYLNKRIDVYRKETFHVTRFKNV